MAKRYRLIVLAIALFSVDIPALSQDNGMLPVSLRAEYSDNPLGIDEVRPRLSWQLTSDERGAVQTGYQVQVAMTPEALDGSNIWDTGKVDSDRSIHVEYEGPALESRHRYYWRIRAWDRHHRASSWSQPAYWEMGFLHPTDWKVQWIEPVLEEDSTKSNPAPILRGEFRVDGEIARARAYVTALGLYQLELNGRRVGDQLFTPGWTSYNTRLQYQTYDITDLLQQGDNAAGVMLGDGWYRGRLAWGEQRNTYGKDLALLTQIVIEYADGREQIVGTDRDWTASTGPIRFSDIYNGELYDARLEKDGWSKADFDDSDWTAVRTVARPLATLIAPAGPPVRAIEELTPVE
ncbi:MAG: alpha-L-rhamnosidase N-terminal domain-containing protein, partial [Rhodothermales bacterium]